MKFVKHSIEGIIEIFPNIFEDERGYFFESYNKNIFLANGINVEFVQDNQSKSNKGVLRGLHFQAPPYAQDKLVRVIQGKVLDVVVDLRKGSKTYGEHAKFVLTPEKQNMVFVPKGFAHGFLVLEDHTIFSYKCSNVYNQQAEGGIMWNDINLNINWEINNPIISQKDKMQTNFNIFDSPFKLN